MKNALSGVGGLLGNNQVGAEPTESYLLTTDERRNSRKNTHTACWAGFLQGGGMHVNHTFSEGHKRGEAR